MKKLICILMSVFIASAAAFGQQGSPELLKDKANFSNTDLFEPESVFMNLQANQELVKAYEANPAAYKDDELLPIAICYMTLRNIEKTKELLEKFMKAKPDDIRAMRTYGTIMLLSGNQEEAFKNYEKAAAKGDPESVKSIASAYILTNTLDNMANYIEPLKQIAKEDLQTANMILIYAYRDQGKRDLALAKSVIEAIDVQKALASATPDSLATALNLYLTEKSVWTPASTIIPARGAILGGHWGIASQAYDEVLKANPKNTVAMRGKAIVEYNLGDTMKASSLLQDAIKLGDEGAIGDAMELVLVTAKTNKEQSDKIYATFKDKFSKGVYNPQIRVAMLAQAINTDGQADMFFMALTGEGSEILLQSPQLTEAVEKGVAKYEGDMRSFDLKKRIEDAKKQ